jgi:hypothetical protein
MTPTQAETFLQRVFDFLKDTEELSIQVKVMIMMSIVESRCRIYDSNTTKVNRRGYATTVAL